MLFTFKGPYLRVTTPITTNGTTPLIVNGQQQFEETHLPITAKKELDKHNAHLKRTGSEHLMAKIEVVG